MPTLSQPTAFAAASVEPDPANGSRTSPRPRGNTARTTWRRNAWGFSEGCGAIARSIRGVGYEAMTSPNGRFAPGRRNPPVPQRLKLSCTRPSSGCRKITQGSNIDLGMTLTS